MSFSAQPPSFPSLWKETKLTNKSHRKVILYATESGSLHGPEVLGLFLLLLGWHGGAEKMKGVFYWVMSKS